MKYLNTMTNAFNDKFNKFNEADNYKGKKCHRT